MMTLLLILIVRYDLLVAELQLTMTVSQLQFKFRSFTCQISDLTVALHCRYYISFAVALCEFFLSSRVRCFVVEVSKHTG